MKVICIDDVPRSYSIDCPSGFNIKEGDVYTVIDEWIAERTGKLLYELEEDTDHYGFEADRFIPLSNIDEMDLSEALQEVEDFESGKKVPMSFEKFLQTL